MLLIYDQVCIDEFALFEYCNLVTANYTMSKTTILFITFPQAFDFLIKLDKTEALCLNYGGKHN